MKDLNPAAFIHLFKEACEKCFGHPLTGPLSETESRHFCNEVLARTGLVIGIKSVKNYSLYVLGSAGERKENPSMATLDTLARYVLNAPYTTEAARKENEAHYPYWFQYLHQYRAVRRKKGWHIDRRRMGISLLVLIVLGGMLVLMKQVIKKDPERFTDPFNAVQQDSLAANGWFVNAKDTVWWNKRGEEPGHLTLFTLRGDNLPDSTNAPLIKNLLLRQVAAGCFTAEVRLDNFVPERNWQQAGILLLEDTVPGARSIRLSVSYNDFFGGYQKPPEIIIQAIASPGSGAFARPEEVAHIPLFSLEPSYNHLVRANLRKSALRIEKRGRRFRLLYAAGPTEPFALKEAASQDFDVEPKYIGLFAIQGFVDSRGYVPARFDSFSMAGIPCDE